MKCNDHFRAVPNQPFPFPQYFTMHTPKFTGRSLIAALFLFCAPALAAPQTNWPIAPKLVELPTPYGTLAVGESEYIYEARLQLDGTHIEPPISGMLSISYAFSMPDAQAALIAISKGSETCPVSYRWVVLSPGGYKVSPEFGSCSELIKVSADSRQLTLHTPSKESPDKLDVYVYDGKTVKKKMVGRKAEAKK